MQRLPLFGQAAAQHWRLRPSTWIAFAVFAWALAACGSGADKPLTRPDAGDPFVMDGGLAGSGGAGPMAGQGVNMAGSGGASGSGGAGAGGTGGSSGGSGGNGGAGGAGGSGGTGGSVAMDCRVNPDTTDEVCPVICPETCNGEDDDCDLRIDEDADAECAATQANTVCSQGECIIVSCEPEHRDCDGDAATGCEISIADDPFNCGGCGLACNLTHAATVDCGSDYTCLVDTCSDTWGNCNNQSDDGCETPLTTLDNCGGCANAGNAEACVGLPRAITTTCDTGTCEVAQCESDWQDCDGDATNGCERQESVVGPCKPEDDCERHDHDGNEYYVCPTGRSWADARARCKLIRRGELVAIGDAGEANWLAGLDADGYWIGASDQAHASLWQWSRSGVPFWKGGDDGSSLPDSFVEWSSGEPAAGGRCAVLGDGGWSALGCGQIHGYVCEVIPDGCPSDPLKSEPGQCDCGVADDDFDDDGVAVCDDECASDPLKYDPGQCGCGIPDTDSDSDGMPDCDESCPDDPNKDAAGACGCGTPDDDTDGDGTEDCNDGCDNDPVKVVPGQCGCGATDDDGDGDGVADCVDECPSDPDKTEMGVCDCGTPDDDTDGDGTEDCNDGCPSDPDKTTPGVCDCGTPDDDTDGDNTFDCDDGCPNDPGKTSPGVCDCGTPDNDSDGDGTPDCNDMCPNDASTTVPPCTLPVSNVDPDDVDLTGAGNPTIDCGNLTFNTDTLTPTTWCGVTVVPLALPQLTGDPEVAVVPLSGLTVASGRTFSFVGSRPIVLIVDGDVDINGTIDVGSKGIATRGAGGNPTGQGCGTGGNGAANSSANDGGGGGGGGGFGQAGAAGQNGNGSGGGGGGGGVANGSAMLTPLRGGCAGGRGGDGWGGASMMEGGYGGGAIQISAAGTLRVPSGGVITAGGGGGRNGNDDEDGGGGGGSGGAILLEANTLDVSSGNLAAHGGGGAEGNDDGSANGCQDGGDGTASGPGLGGNGCGGINGGAGGTLNGSGPVTPSSSGSESGDGGGGGGGGAGRVYTRLLTGA